MRYFRGLALSLAALVGILACDKEGHEQNTPLRSVWLNLPLQAQPYRALLEPTGAVTIVEPPTETSAIGYAGVLIVHSLLPNQFYAYDLSCPVENSPIIRIVGHDPLNVRCPKCQTKYDVLSGSGAVLSGSGRSPLRKYKAFYHEVERKLTISN